jgi:hypothetical protein
MDYSHPAGKGFGNAFHQMKLLGTRNPEKTRRPALVHSHFEVWQKLGRVLDFIDEHGRWKSLEKKRRIFPGKTQNQWVIEAHIGSLVPAEMQQKRGLPHLPCSRKQQYGKLGGGTTKKGFKGSRDIHKELHGDFRPKFSLGALWTNYPNLSTIEKGQEKKASSTLEGTVSQPCLHTPHESSLSYQQATVEMPGKIGI